MKMELEECLLWYLNLYKRGTVKKLLRVCRKNTVMGPSGILKKEEMLSALDGLSRDGKVALIRKNHRKELWGIA